MKEEDPYEVHRLDPLTDKQKEMLFNSQIKYMTKEEIIEKYGDILTEEQEYQLKMLGI